MKKLLKPLVILSISVYSFLGLTIPDTTAQIINTYAGTGTAAFGGDGGAATSAQLNKPTGIAVDASGNLYIADIYNHRVRKVTPAGVITTVAGGSGYGYSGDGGPATAADLTTPTGVAVDGSGNLFICDQNNNCIRIVNSSGTINTYAGSGTMGFSGDGGPATAAQLSLPFSIATDGSGNLYIADQNNQRVRKVTTSGIISTVAGTGTAGFSGDGAAATAAMLRYPCGLVVDASGNLLIADEQNNRIRKVTPSGIISTFAGLGSTGFSGDGGTATAAEFYSPWGLGLDGAGNLYIADGGNQCIRKVNTSGIVSTIAGIGSSGGFSGDGGPATAAQLLDPGGVVIDGSGNIFIDDYYNNRIRYIAASNHAPYFIGGVAQSIVICENAAATAINSWMSINDIDAGQTESWTVLTSPLHGTLGGFPTTATSTGSAITPGGLTYMPTAGYSGNDSFVVGINDGIGGSSTTIHMTMNALTAGTITGIDSVCIGDTITLNDGEPGGVWHSQNTAIATITSGGNVIGISAGIDTIKYVVTSICGVDTAFYVIKVRSYASCYAGTQLLSAPDAEILNIYPNPGQGNFRLYLSSQLQQDALVTITNVLGVTIKELKVTTNKDTQLELNVNNGIYFIHTLVGGVMQTQKLIIQ